MNLYNLSSLYSALRIMDIQLDIVEKGWSYPNHQHSYFEFIYCISGEFEQWVNGEVYLLKPGDAILVKPDLYHHSLTHIEAEYLVFHFDIEMKEVHSVFQLVKNPRIFSEEMVNDRESITHWVTNFIEEFKIKPQKKAPNLMQEDYLENMHSAVSILRLHSRVIELISVLAQHFLSKERLQDSDIPPSQIKIAHEVANWLEKNLSNKVKIEDLAKELNLHRSYLSQCFKKTYGMSPSNYLIRIRIREARRLLLETDMPIELISYQLAFYSAGHFSRTFRSLMGLSPLQFRKDKKITMKKMKKSLVKNEPRRINHCLFSSDQSF
ncbi:AraC family transcriptional regulator [Bacillus sp. FJAT-29790]|uniref:AraC family transcriptional regulator n=1 Tax=Bacillus sp. FJAT-29790 TaxID=1895002 RepID=UPI001C231DB4|nr:AraC family transcriptional regulator [Bacillus sp. FJAT-29790]MBU8879258.1 AraC family transcriptional regulator [Bacillus sp. FJAT-29790]